MTTITGIIFGPTLREMAVAECRVAGQGLRKGDKYLLTEMTYEATGKDMLTTEGVVHSMNGDIFEVLNMHIAFDLEELLQKQGI
jgi:hypothetical protein